MFIQDLVAPSIKQEQEVVKEKTPTKHIVIAVLGPSSDWRQPFIRYLTTIDILADNIEREHLTRRSKHYVHINEKLYRRNTKGKLLHKCVSMEEGKKILNEIHAGTCGNHAASRTLVKKAF